MSNVLSSKKNTDYLNLIDFTQLSEAAYFPSESEE